MTSHPLRNSGNLLLVVWIYGLDVDLSRYFLQRVKGVSRPHFNSQPPGCKPLCFEGTPFFMVLKGAFVFFFPVFLGGIAKKDTPFLREADLT